MGQPPSILHSPNGTIDLFAFNNGSWQLLSSGFYETEINTRELGKL
jgi:hypothetical protein